LLIGGGVAGILAYAQHADAVKAGPPPSQAVYDATKNGISTKAWIADGLYAAGIVAAGVGLALVLTAPSGGVTSHAPAPSASVSAAPIIGGGALVVSGGF
jgi:hypothetical protein